MSNIKIINKSFQWKLFWVVLSTCIVWTLAHAFFVDQVTTRLCNLTDRGIPHDERIPVFLDPIAYDGYVWNVHAENLGNQGSWRLRYTYFDNYPYGREVHWNSFFAYYLRAMGELHSHITGSSLRNSIFMMSIWANPLLFLIMLLLFIPLFAKRFGAASGSLLAIGVTGESWFNEGFLPAYPDHHGLIAFSILAFFSGLLWSGAGWLRYQNDKNSFLPDNYQTAKQGMVLSALGGAMGLMVSALSAAMVIVSVASAFLIICAFSIYSDKSAMKGNFHPKLWRIWGFWGAGTSFFLYLLEYFPSYISLRLEVNHPFYSIAWLGGGLFLERFSQWAIHGRKDRQSFPWQYALLSMALCSVLPLTILLRGSSVFMPLDPFIIRLHENITEFMPMWVIYGSNLITWIKALIWVPGMFIPLYFFLKSDKPAMEEKQIFALGSIAVSLMLAMQFYQNRWGHLTGPLFLTVLALLIPRFWQTWRLRAILRPLVFMAIVLVYYICSYPTIATVTRAGTQYFAGSNVIPSQEQLISLLRRQIVRTIQIDAQGRPVVLLAGPDSSSTIAPLGGFHVIGNLFWENRNGMLAASEGFHKETLEEAYAFVKERQITHILLYTWDSFVGHHADSPDVSLEKSFIKRLFIDRQIPHWCRLVPFKSNEITRALGQEVMILKVVPEQTWQESLVHHARFLREVDDTHYKAEEFYLLALRENPADTNLKIEIALFYLSNNYNRKATEYVIKAMPSLEPQARGELAEKVAQNLSEKGEKELAAEIIKWVK